MNEMISTDTKMEYKGNTKTIQEWCLIYGLNLESTLEKVKAGLDIESIITYKAPKRERMLTFKGKTQNIRMWAAELGIPYATLKSRFNVLHLSVEEALTMPHKARS